MKASDMAHQLMEESQKESVEEKEETVEYNGKRYNKKAFEAAIEQLCIEEK